MSLGMSAGLSATDFDGDGDVDLFVPCAGGTHDRLYVNDGTGHFMEAGERAGAGGTAAARAGLWFDADGDGFMTFEEIKTWIVPEDFDHADTEAKYLVGRADGDGDGEA